MLGGMNRLATIGAVIADPTRSEVLCALMDGRARTGSELSRHVGVAASTMSEHLAKLLDAGMVTVEAQGRHRYWRLAAPEIADLIETLGAHPGGPPPEPNAPSTLRHARTCYDHMAGEVAVRIYDALLERKAIAVESAGITLTESGRDLLDRLGANVAQLDSGRRPPARACLDWTQRRHHLAGGAGKLLLITVLANNWAKPGPRPRSLRITPAGRRALAEHFDL